MTKPFIHLFRASRHPKLIHYGSKDLSLVYSRLFSMLAWQIATAPIFLILAPRRHRHDRRDGCFRRIAAHRRTEDPMLQAPLVRTTWTFDPTRAAWTRGDGAGDRGGRADPVLRWFSSSIQSDLERDGRAISNPLEFFQFAYNQPAARSKATLLAVCCHHTLEEHRVLMGCFVDCFLGKAVV